MKTLSWAQAAAKMRLSYPNGDVPGDLCPNLQCGHGCPFYIKRTETSPRYCEMTHESKGQNAYKIALARAIESSLDII